MTFSFRPLRATAAALLALTVSAGVVGAGELRVMSSGGLTAAYKEALPGFEATSGHRVETAFGASMGGAPDSIPSRLSRGEPADVVIMAGTAIDMLIEQGRIASGSRVDLARSLIGVSVRAGAPKPDISSIEALKRTLLDAKSIAYSASASGTYLSTELFPKLGVAEAIKNKVKRIESERVGTVVARGDAELGFQQVSELKPIPGLDFVGVLPPEAQKVTVFSAGVATGAKDTAAAKALIDYLASPAARPAIEASGMEPILR